MSGETKEKKSYKDSLNLPKTEFPMKANLRERESVRLKEWEETKLYQKIRDLRNGSPNYTLHDGPPYPNGDIHMGHVLNKVLKDIIVKYKTMAGFDAPYIPGWDCHGLPIEHKVMTNLGDKAAKLEPHDIRKLCEEYAMKYVGHQRDQFKRLLVFGDWQNPYLTLHPSYEAGIVEVFGKLLEKGYIYRGHRPIHWCITCQTALAEAEIEYHQKNSPSAYVKFELTSDAAEIFGYDKALDDHAYMLIWTTTPWTLPANLAIAVGPEIDYAAVLLEENGKKEVLILADKLVDKVCAMAGKAFTRVGKTVKGKKLEQLDYKHNFIDRQSPVVMADYVSTEDGTGCVHTAPGHGKDDYVTGLKYNLVVLSPVNKAGCFTFEAPEFIEGLKVFAANPKVLEQLKSTGHLFHAAEVSHDYPHCWRCVKPVIFRATEQWFISVDHKDLRGRALKAIREEIRWVPDWSINRITGMIDERPDWCISRQRHWGVPIPAFYCADCGEITATTETTEAVRKLFAKEGANSWFLKSPEEILGPKAKCESCGSKNLSKEKDIFDVWFESGSSHRSVVLEREGLQYPADLYIEGSDQHRGWFQLTLLPALGAQEQIPFKAVVTHGFTVDEKGMKMSKKLGNYIAAPEAVDKYGADVLRLFVASSNFFNDVAMSDSILTRMSDGYRNIRNRFRYMLSNLYDYNPAQNAVAFKDMEEIDRWALMRLGKVVNSAKQAYEEFQFSKLFHHVHTLTEVDLSSFYMEVVRDRLYADAPNSRRRRSAQTALHLICRDLALLMAPILSFTCEEVWGELKNIDKSLTADSVHLADLPQADGLWANADIEGRWDRLLKIRAEVTRELEKLRAAKTIGSSLEGSVTLWTENDDMKKFLSAFGPSLTELFITSEVDLASSKPNGASQGLDLPELWVKAEKTSFVKCPRCWMYTNSGGTYASDADICGRCADTLTR